MLVFSHLSGLSDTLLGMIFYMFIVPTAYDSIHRLHFLQEMHERGALAVLTPYEVNAED